jgi:hypothetical protein
MWVAEVTQAAVPTIGRFWGFLQTNTGKKVFASAVLIYRYFIANNIWET